MSKENVFLLVLLLSFGVTGCVKQGFNPSQHAAPRTLVGTVSAYKSLESIGSVVTSEIRFYAATEGQIIVQAGDGTSENIVVKTDSDEFLVFLKKCIEWGDIAKKEQAEIEKYMGRLSDNGLGYTSGVGFVFGSYAGGQRWYLKQAFSFFSSWGGGLHSTINRDVNYVIDEKGVSKMIQLLGKREEIIQKAKSASEKSHLFQ